MAATDIQQEVEARVKARLISELIPVLEEQHRRNSFRRGCTCNYCTTKRWVSHRPGWSYYSQHDRLYREARERLNGARKDDEMSWVCMEVDENG